MGKLGSWFHLVSKDIKKVKMPIKTPALYRI
jgi:hypothetical protein